MASEHVQATIKYHFSDSSLLLSALRAPHRSDIDGTSDDGHRSLAKIGVHAIEMVELQNTITANSRTNNTKICDYWPKSKEGQASVCKGLGISSYIVQSPRQGHQEPSTKVLANALCAIIGAVWLDLENQETSLASSYSVVLELVRQMNIAVANVAEGVPSLRDRESSILLDEGGGPSTLPELVTTATTPNQAANQEISPIDAFALQWFNELQSASFGSMSTTLHASNDTWLELDVVPGNEIQIQMQNTNILRNVSIENANALNSDVLLQLNEGLEHSLSSSYAETGGVFDASPNPGSGPENPSASSKPGKRKQLHEHSQRCDNNALHYEALRVELQKLDNIPASDRANLEVFLDHAQIRQLSTDPSQVLQLRFMYLAIGSCQSLIDFREQLRSARNIPDVYPQLVSLTLTPMERFSEICRLDNEEALCVLMRRYHVVKLCETQRKTFLRSFQMVIETPQTFDPAHGALIGNPLTLQEAALTNELLSMVKPGLSEGTREYQRYRRRVKLLQKLARNLQILINIYGFGILALLPSEPSYSGLSLTDKMLSSISEQKFQNFSDLLYQQQGSYLLTLSQAVESPVLALVTRKLDSERMFPIEGVDMGLLEDMPKGSSDILRLVLVHGS